MKVLFGIQGTGNGHISRCRELLKHLLVRAEVDVLVSGYHHEVDLGFDVKFKLPGLGFTFGKRGGIDYWNSVRNFSPYKLISDIYKIPVHRYDLVISDFEPITAWSAKLRGAPSVSLSHQAAFFSPNIPRPRQKNRIQELIIKWYSPSPSHIGLHFQEYDDFIFTPIIREEIRNTDVINRGHYTVYLPSYDYSFLSGLFRKIDVKWEVFSKHHKGEPYRDSNVTVFPVNNAEFVRSLSECEGILCNAGFETPAETLYLGKKLMVIPMRRQYEQQCNAEALERLGVPVVRDMGNEFENKLCDWINSDLVYNADYKNNLSLIVERIFDSSSRTDTLNDYIQEHDLENEGARASD
jgi:uncharacterized protein (TIGR00661 family)